MRIVLYFIFRILDRFGLVGDVSGDFDLPGARAAVIIA
jgi:hypothetical protein